MKSGKKFEYEIRNSLKILSDTFWFRIQDASSYMSMIKDAPVRIGKQPGDFFAVMNGVPCLIECKSSKSKKGYNSSYIKEHQLQYNKDCILAGGNAWLLIKKNVKGEYAVWYLTADEFELLVKEKKRKVLKWSDFPDNRELIKLKGSKWDLSPLFNIVK